MSEEQPVTALSTEAGRALLRRFTGDPVSEEPMVRNAISAIEREAVADLRASLAAEVRELKAPPEADFARGQHNRAIEEAARLIEGDTECGEKNHPGSHRCNAPKGHEPGPEQGGHYCRYEWNGDTDARER